MEEKVDDIVNILASTFLKSGKNKEVWHPLHYEVQKWNWFKYK
jgi:hypothetical protein